MRVALIAATLLVLAACTTGTIDGHRITATANIPQSPQALPDLYDEAPEEARDIWRRYLAQADGRYAVLAADRKGRGAGWVYCNAYCQNAMSPAFKSHNDVVFKHGALKLCRKYVRQNYPAQKPDCAIFAIKDKIVWKGKLPWK